MKMEKLMIDESENDAEMEKAYDPTKTQKFALCLLWKRRELKKVKSLIFLELINSQLK